MTYPLIRIRGGHDKRLRSGSPWVYSNELDLNAEAKALPPGSIVGISDGRHMLGLAHFNPNTLVAARILSRRNDSKIDRKFIERRLKRAVALRERTIEAPYYRVVHAEGDALPGLIVDRYGDIVVVQINTAGMEALRDDVLSAIDRVLAPKTVVLRNDSIGRTLEGLDREPVVAKGKLEGPVELIENDLTFYADCAAGQKTGWYFDQRLNRAFASRLARGKDVLDLYAHSGGFALNALANGAKSALAVDRSAPALELAKASATQQKATEFETKTSEVPAALEELRGAKRKFGLVVADPPAFVPTKKDLSQGLRAYRRLASTAATVVEEGGILAIACCSHNVGRDLFLRETYAGIRAAGRGAWLVHEAGAGPDHPIHPALPETGYLKFFVYALD